MVIVTAAIENKYADRLYFLPLGLFKLKSPSCSPTLWRLLWSMVVDWASLEPSSGTLLLYNAGLTAQIHTVRTCRNEMYRRELRTRIL